MARWNNEQIEFLIETYETTDNETLADILEMKPIDVEWKAVYLGLKKNRQIVNRYKEGDRVIRNYIYIFKPTHPKADRHGFVTEHILVMEEHIGRSLKPNERVIHKNKNTHDNNIDNLYIKTFKCKEVENPQQVIEEYKNGLNIKSISNKYNISYNAVRKIIEDEKVKRNSTVQVEKRAIECGKYIIENRKSLKETALELGYYEASVNKYIYGILKSVDVDLYNKVIKFIGKKRSNSSLQIQINDMIEKKFRELGINLGVGE